MSSSLTITTEEKTGKAPVTIFHLKGDIDTNTSMQLQDKATEAIQNGTRNLLLDLSEVKYISSAGLRVLHNIYTMLRNQSVDESEELVSKGLMDGTYKSHHLKLLNPSQNVDIVLKTAGFDMYISSYHNLQAALTSF